MFENWNSLRLWTQPKRVSDINKLIDKYEVDCFLGCETQCDWGFAMEEKKFHNIFGIGEQKRHVVGFNKTGKKIQREQHGGTAAMAVGRFASYVLETGTDSTGLGRWSWIVVGQGETRTRIVVAYNPGGKKDSAWRTVFDQQSVHFEAQGDFRSPGRSFMKT